MSATKWAVLNCGVTQILAVCESEEDAERLAAEFGRCSFAYRLSPTETAALCHE